MTDTPTDDQPGFIAETPEHCHACHRLIPRGQTYYLTIGDTWLCEDCILDKDAIRVVDDLVVVIEENRLVVQRGDATVAILPSEVRHLVDGLVEGAAREKLIAGSCAASHYNSERTSGYYFQAG